MPTQTIEIEDNLDEILESAIEDTKQLLIGYLEDNPDTTDVPCLHNDLDYSGEFHEIIDSAVPIYTKEIKDLWYLYGNKFEEAYENAGIGNDSRENDGMVAIYCYLEQEVAEWYQNNSEDIFEEWMEEHQEEDDEED